MGEEGGGEAAAGGWRERLGRRLASRLSKGRFEPILFGQLFDEIEPLIPEFEASRMWAVYESVKRFATVRQMRWLTLIRALGHYPMETPRMKGLAWERDSFVEVKVRNCRYCGTQFIARKPVTACSRSHGALAWRQEKARAAKETQWLLYGRQRAAGSRRRSILTSVPGETAKAAGLRVEALVPVPKVVVLPGKGL